MRHQRTRHQLSRSASHRRSLLRNLAKEVIDHERIKTTEAKAKKGGLYRQRDVISFIRDREMATKLFEEIGPRYTDRPGGYTRILKLGPRAGDQAPMARIEFV